MSVLVKGMKMPENCRECPFENYYSDTGKTVCMASLRVLAIGFGIISFDGRHSSCPLVALPDKHGRLVDADALCEDLLGRWSVAETRKEDLIKAVMADVVTPIIACQPTIVESEDGT